MAGVGGGGGRSGLESGCDWKHLASLEALLSPQSAATPCAWACTAIQSAPRRLLALCYAPFSFTLTGSQQGQSTHSITQLLP